VPVFFTAAFGLIMSATGFFMKAEIEENEKDVI